MSEAPASPVPQQAPPVSPTAQVPAELKDIQLHDPPNAQGAIHQPVIPPTRFWEISGWSWTFVASLGFILLMILLSRWPELSVHYVLLLSPYILLVRWAYQNQSTTKLDLVVRYLAWGFWPMGLGALLGEVILLFLLFIIFPKDADSDTTYGLCTKGVCAVFATLAIGYVVIGPLEEGVKYWFATRPDTSRRQSQGTKAGLIYSTSLAMGFASAMCVLYGLTACVVWLEYDADYNWRYRSRAEDFGLCLLIALLTMFFYVPMHTLTAYLMSVKLAILHFQPDHSTSATVGVWLVPWLVRGTLGAYCSVPLYWIAHIESTALMVFVIFVGFAVVLVPLMFYIKRVEKRLPPAYRARVGQLNILGYGMLEQDDNSVVAAAVGAGGARPVEMAGVQMLARTTSSLVC